MTTIDLKFGVVTSRFIPQDSHRKYSATNTEIFGTFLGILLRDLYSF